MHIQSTISIGMSSGGFVPQVQMGEVINSRFGDILVDVAKAVTFPGGLLGMPDKAHFVLSSFHSPKMQQFSILQSLDDVQLSFITLPLDLANDIISAADLREAADTIGIEHDDLAILLIVSVQRSPNNVRISVNARAPLLVDAKRRVGAQYVFPHDRYKVQQWL